MHIQCIGIEKKFGARTILRGVALDAAPGDVVVLHGPSGIGKSTLLRLIAGLETPDAGEILLDGQIVSGTNVYVPPAARGLGMVFQDFALWPHMDIEKHLRFVLNAQRVPRGEHAARIENLIDLCGLGALRRSLPRTLSGGEQQRVGIARALVGNPRLLLLDEPFAHLDPALRARILAELMRRAREESATIIAATHDTNDFAVEGVRHLAFEGL